MPGVSRSVLVTRSASSTTSREFSRIGSHSLVLVGFYRGQAFQHLVPFERDAAMPRMRAGKHRAPHRVRVEHCATFHVAHNRQM